MVTRISTNIPRRLRMISYFGSFVFYSPNAGINTEKLVCSAMILSFYQNLNRHLKISLKTCQNSSMIRISLFILSVLFSSSLQAQESRSLVVDLSLDVGQVERSLSLQVTVFNHSFVVVSVFPFVAIRPITSEVSTLVQLSSGQRRVTAVVEDILADTVSHRIQIECLNCSDTIPRQFYRPEGNTISMPNSIFLNAEDLPAQIESNLITLAEIGGQISLINGQSLDRDLVFEVSARPVLTGSELQSQTVTLEVGQNSVAYLLQGLTRNTNDIKISARCMACRGVAPVSQIFPQALSTQANLRGIDFNFDADAVFRLNGVLDIILHED